MSEDFIKKGVIDSEQAGAAIKTASDELVKSAEVSKTCSNGCRCKCKTNEEKKNVSSNGN